MKESRNPFRLRASEYIESDNTFIRLFGPEVLDTLPTEQTFSKVHFLRSAEGGGKTSLLRLFSPNVLLTLYSLRKREDCKELYQKMCNLGAISDDGAQVLGITLSCASNYAALEDMEIDLGRKERLLYGLLNARIVLAALRGAMTLKKLEYPSDLSKLKVNVAHASELPLGLDSKCDGKNLYDWATGLERKVCEAIDSFGPSKIEALTGNGTLSSLFLIAPGAISIDNQPVARHVFLMLDDVQKLTVRQRRRLLQTLIDLRSSVGVWVSERFEALSTDEMLASGSKQGREYGKVILLENYWRGYPRKFEKFVSDIAERRARNADAEIETFSQCLQSSLDGAEWRDKLSEILETIVDRVREIIKSHAEQKTYQKSQFNEWLTDREKMDGTIWERAVAWRALEILIEREKRKSQPSLLDEPLSVDALRKKDDSAVRASAELFLAKEFNLPYYYGPTMLSKLASANIEQYLWLAGDQFEEIVSAALLKKATDLTPVRQQAILKKASDALWNDIPKRVRHGREVRDFLESLGRFCQWMTYKPTAPNDIGVNGTAILMRERTLLMNREEIEKYRNYDDLAKTVASAIAHNLLEPVLDYSCKNKQWMVLNLNRLLCVKFNLPLNYGKFKEKSLDELNVWLQKGYYPPKRDTSLII